MLCPLEDSGTIAEAEDVVPAGADATDIKTRGGVTNTRADVVATGTRATVLGRLDGAVTTGSATDATIPPVEDAKRVPNPSAVNPGAPAPPSTSAGPSSGDRRAPSLFSEVRASVPLAWLQENTPEHEAKSRTA